MKISIRFPDGEIKVYNHDFRIVKGLVAAHFNIAPQNQLYFQDGSLLPNDWSCEGTVVHLDLVVNILGDYVLCSSVLEAKLRELNYITLVPPQSSVRERNIETIDHVLRFYDINNIFFKKDDLQKKFKLKAAPFISSFETHRETRLTKIKNICDTLRSKVIVTCTFNEPYIVLFKNFLASCDKNNIDIRDSLIVFPMDEAAAQACLSYDVKYYYEQDAYGPTTSTHGTYGDADFATCMFMNNAIVKDLLDLDYNVLFMDIDVVWLKDPLEYLYTLAHRQGFDFLFMFDGINARFQPLYYNSGFFYCKNNPFTRKVWNLIFYNYDKVLTYRSQQAPLNIIINTMRQRGLRTDRLNEIEFLNGHRLNPNKRNIGSIGKETYVLHASWTSNIDGKIKNLKSMNQWYIE